MLDRCGSPRRGCGRLRSAARRGDLTLGILNGGYLIPHVLGDEGFRVQILDLQVGVLGAEFLTQLSLSIVRDIPDSNEHPGCLPGEARKFLGPEHDDAEYQKKDQLGGVDIEHRIRLPAAEHSTNPNEPPKPAAQPLPQAKALLMYAWKFMTRCREQRSRPSGGHRNHAIARLPGRHVR